MNKLCLLLSLTLLSACTAYTYYDPTKPHHGPEGFRNTNPNAQIGNGFWKWQWERWRADLPKPAPPGGWPIPVVQADAAYLKANVSEATLTWIGHATLLLQLNGINILTDPNFSERASPLSFVGPKRQVGLPLSIADLPHIDIVVISHNHYDHLDRDTVKQLNAQPGGAPQFFVPLGLKAWFNGEGIDNISELDWWDRRTERGLMIHSVPVQHWSARGPADRNKTLWCGWVIEAPNLRFFFAGDTGYSQDFRDIGRRFGGFDLAALPIGAYEPRWFMQTQHINPEEAVRIHQDLHARYSVGIHWGTFVLTDEPLDEPPKKLQQALAAARISPERFFVMQHGQTRKLDDFAIRDAAVKLD
jgi:L-ascorbate metabolism protein UlaG (beta-lactamase superfamily)